MNNPQTMDRVERRVALFTIFTPLLGLIVTIFLLFGHGVTLLDVSLLAGMYLVSVLGISLGYHRYFTHRGFKCPTVVAAGLAIAGAMSAQGPVIFWTACHRRHHQHSDAEEDPHSPHHHGVGFGAYVRGFWHAHMGWMLNHKPLNYRRQCPDLLKERWLVGVDKRYFLWVGLGLLLPAAIGGACTRSWAGFGEGFLWGGLVRIFLGHHATWSVNSVCHLFGAAPYETGDKSRNNPLCALLTFGEGWHNNHHAFPVSARHGLAWWELDCSYLLLRTMAVFHLVWDIRTPTAAELNRKLPKGQSKPANPPAGQEGCLGGTAPAEGASGGPL